MNPMKLYYADVMNPRKVCALARYLESPVEFVYVNLEHGEQTTPEYLALNPNGKVPVLDTGAGTVWESNAIMCFLARHAGSSLWPEDERQIDVLRWLCWDLQHFSRFGGQLYFEYVIKARFNVGPVDKARVEEATGNFRKYAAVLDAHLGERKYLAGDAMTVADFAVAVSLPYAEIAHIPLAEFPAVERWHARLNALPAWREPFPA